MRCERLAEQDQRRRPLKVQPRLIERLGSVALGEPVEQKIGCVRRYAHHAALLQDQQLKYE